MHLFIIHVTFLKEIPLTVSLITKLKEFYPGANIIVIKQLDDETNFECETILAPNIKTSFTWTKRFLFTAIQAGASLVIKVDPDTIIQKHIPLNIPKLDEPVCFGQKKLIENNEVFLGGFQGFNDVAAKAILPLNPTFSKSQDLALAEAIKNYHFIPLPFVELAAVKWNHDPSYHILHFLK